MCSTQMGNLIASDTNLNSEWTIQNKAYRRKNNSQFEANKTRELDFFLSLLFIY